MSLTDLAAVGSFINGVAVLVSFVFVAYQLHENAHNQRATMHIARAALVQEKTRTTSGCARPPGMKPCRRRSCRDFFC